MAGCYLVDMLRGFEMFSLDEYFVQNGFQHIALVGSVELKPGDLQGTSSCSLLRVRIASVLHQDDSASTRKTDTPDELYVVVLGPVAPVPAGTSAPPTC